MHTESQEGNGFQGDFPTAHEPAFQHGKPGAGPCPFPKFFPSQLLKDDAFFMRLAFNQAVDAWRAGEVPIGAIVTVGEEIVGAAFNQVEQTGDPTAHAEILAITQASRAIGDWRLAGATLYVTKEPCPMCSGATIMSRLYRVVYGLPDPRMGCMGGGTSLHQLPGLNHRVEVTAGVLEDECRAILQAFFRKKRENTSPWVDDTPTNGIG